MSDDATWEHTYSPCDCRPVDLAPAQDGRSAVDCSRLKPSALLAHQHELQLRSDMGVIYGSATCMSPCLVTRLSVSRDVYINGACFREAIRLRA